MILSQWVRPSFCLYISFFPSSCLSLHLPVSFLFLFSRCVYFHSLCTYLPTYLLTYLPTYLPTYVMMSSVLQVYMCHDVLSNLSPSCYTYYTFTNSCSLTFFADKGYQHLFPSFVLSLKSFNSFIKQLFNAHLGTLTFPKNSLAPGKK